MKRFARMMAAALIMLLFAALLSIPAGVSADGGTPGERVIYISDDGTGDGSSPSSPLKAETVVEKYVWTDEAVANGYADRRKYTAEECNNYWFCTGDKTDVDTMEGRYYMNSVLYQAALEISDTGGRIVLVGDVTIGYSKSSSYASLTSRDFNFPDYSNKITISAQNGARLIITEGAHITLGGETLFENIAIATTSTALSTNGGVQNRAICANGHKVVFGDGITTSNLQGRTGAYYPSIAGARRFASSYYSFDVDVTINSGTWYQVFGVTTGITNNPDYSPYANVKMTINGGEYLSMISCASKYNVYDQVMDVDLTINGGTFSSSSTIYASGPRGCMYPDNVTNIKITGGTFNNSTVKAYLPAQSGTNIPVDYLPTVNLDLSECTLSESNVKRLATDFAQYADSGAGIGSVTFPAQYCTGASVRTPASDSFAFVGGSFNADGLSITANYTIGGTEYSSIIDYNEKDPLFTFEFDNSSAGSKSVTYKYNGVTYCNGTLNVIAIPRLYLLGAQIRVNADENQTLRFVARVDKLYGSEITLGDYGFIALPSSLFNSDSLDFESVYGANELISTGTVFRPAAGEIYNSGSVMTFSGVYPDLSISEYGKEIKTVAFTQFTYAGKEYYAYSDIASKSVISVASAAYASDDERAEDKAWIKTNVIDAYSEYSSSESYDPANADLLREKIVEYMNETADFEWTPSSDMTVSFPQGNSTTTYTLRAGTTYKGLPYIYNKKATLEEFKEYITVVPTSTGTRNVYTGPTIDLTPATVAGSGVYSTHKENYTHDSLRGPVLVLNGDTLPLYEMLPGTDYGGIINAWNKVCSNSTFFTTMFSLMPVEGRRGAVKVGNYVTGSDTSVIVASSGEDTMYESYAKIRKGDVILTYYSNDRSVRMAVSDASVVRRTDGSIDPAQSKVTYRYAASSLSSNSFYRTVTASFADLYNQKRIPVAFPEIATGLDTQTVTTLQHFDGEEIISSGKLQGDIYSNHSIISVNVSFLRDKDEGIAIYDKTRYYTSIEDQNVNRVSLTDFPDIADSLKNCVEGKSYILRVTANVASEGEKVLVEYGYVKPLNDMTKFASYHRFGAIPDNTQRDTVVDYMYEMAQYEWTPTVNFSYVRNPYSSFTPSSLYEVGKIYHGVAYTNNRTTSFEFDELLGTDPGTKVFDPLQFVPLGEENSGYFETRSGSDFSTARKSYMTASPDGLTKTVINTYNGKTIYYIDWNRMLGNHCASSLTNALQQAVRITADNAKNNPNGLDIMLPHDLYSFTKSMAKLYGENAMYEHYALVKKGDICYTRAGAGGHNRCAYEDAHVVRRADGTIDPEQSYIVMIEQTDTLESSKNPSFVAEHGYDTTWWVGHKYTFYFLYNTNYAMFNTTSEYLTGESEEPFIGLTKKTSADSISSGVYGVVESNYPILMVRMRITDRTSGEIVAEKKFCQHQINTINDAYKYYKYNIMTLYSNLNFGSLPSGNYTYTLEGEIAKGIILLDSCDFSK